MKRIESGSTWNIIKEEEERKAATLRQKEARAMFSEIDIEDLSGKMETDPFRRKSLIDAFMCLVYNLKERLPIYDTILSDDASGRLVSLVLRKVINRAREQRREKPVRTYFLATGRHERFPEEIDRNIESFLEKKKPHIGKALVVTEHISSGDSMNSIVDILEKLEIGFDIASLSVFYPRGRYGNSIDSRLTYGSESSIGLDLYHDQSGGVIKDVASLSPRPKRVEGPYASKSAAMARRDAERLADAMIKVLMPSPEED